MHRRRRRVCCERRPMLRLPIAAARASLAAVFTPDSETCLIERFTSAVAYDYATATFTDGTWATVYEGTCGLFGKAVKGVVAHDGDATLVNHQSFLRVPAPDIEFEVGDRVTITGSEMDETAIGSQWRVLIAPKGSFTISRRLMIDVWHQEDHLTLQEAP